MNAAAAIHLLGLAGVLPSRAFIPAFVVAMAMRFGQNTAYIQKLGLTGPTWFTQDATLIILGVLSVLELVATKSHEVREYLNEFDGYVKAAMAFIVTMGVLDASDTQTLDAVRQAGFGTWIFGALLAAAVFFLAGIRSMTLRLFLEADQNDDLGVQGLLSWVEDLWVLFGVLILIFYPLVMLTLAGLFFMFIFLVRKYFERREEQRKVPCPACAQPVHPTALRCAACKAEFKDTHGIGFFGRCLSTPTADRARQALELVEYRRCPECANPLTERAARQTCAACGHVLMGEGVFAEQYLAFIDARVVKVLWVSLAFSFVPVVGAMPAIIYSRLALVAPFRRYIPLGIGCLIKWLVRVVNLVLILLQVVPVLGAVMMPLMALLNYWVYRQVYRSSLES